MVNLIEMNRHLAAPVEKVWDALADRAKVGTWFALRANVVPRRGGACEPFWQPDNPEQLSTIGRRISAIVPGRY